MQKDKNCFLYTLSSLWNNQPHTQRFSFSEKTLAFYAGCFVNVSRCRQPEILTTCSFFNLAVALASLKFGNEQLRPANPPFFCC